MKIRLLGYDRKEVDGIMDKLCLQQEILKQNVAYLSNRCENLEKELSKVQKNKKSNDKFNIDKKIIKSIRDSIEKE